MKARPGRRVQLSHYARGPNDEVKIRLYVQPGSFMALDQGVPYEFSYGFFGQGSAVDGLGKDLLSWLGGRTSLVIFTVLLTT